MKASMGEGKSNKDSSNKCNQEADATAPTPSGSGNGNGKKGLKQRTRLHVLDVDEDNNSSSSSSNSSQSKSTPVPTTKSHGKHHKNSAPKKAEGKCVYYVFCFFLNCDTVLIVLKTIHSNLNLFCWQDLKCTNCISWMLWDPLVECVCVCICVFFGFFLSPFSVRIKIIEYRLLNSKCTYCAVANVLDCNSVVSKFKLQLCYYVHFLTNTLVKGMNPLILHLQLWIK